MMLLLTDATGECRHECRHGRPEARSTVANRNLSSIMRKHDPGRTGAFACLLRIALILLCLTATVSAQTQTYDLLLQGGRVVDAKNNIDAVRDVAILDGKIAAVATRIDPASALKVVNAAGLY